MVNLPRNNYTYDKLLRYIHVQLLKQLIFYHVYWQSIHGSEILVALTDSGGVVSMPINKEDSNPFATPPSYERFLDVWPSRKSTQPDASGEGVPK